MVRYRDVEDPDSGRTLLITAGVIAGLLAGAVVAHRLGGWRGLQRALRAARGRGAPALALLREFLPPGTLSTLLQAVKADELVAALLGQGERASRRRRRRRRPDVDLDEYEVDEVERAAAGLHHDLDEADADDADGAAGDSETDDELEADDHARLGRRLRPPRAGRRAVADVEDDEEVEDDEDDEDDEHGAHDEHVAHDEDEEDDDELDEGEEDEIAPRLSPEAIEGEVLAAFRRHPILRQRALEIAVDDDGVLELTGWVRSERELRLARRVARRVRGVEGVVVDVAIRDVRRDRRRPEADTTPA